MIRRSRLFWYCCIFLVVSLLPAAAMADINILAFGDSITHGVINSDGVTEMGYEPPLEALFTAAGQTATVLNYGSSGENTADGLSRLQRVLGGNSYLNYVLILEGTNDFDDGISEQSTIFNLGQMIASVRAAGMLPVISNLIPETIEPEKNIPTTYNPDIYNLAVQENVLFADNYTPLSPSWASYTIDGRHPNQAGYNIMAGVWYNAMGGGTSTDSAASSGSSGGGCFIATAAFGSLLEPRVVLLQQFRDAYLLTNTPGKAFVRLYYRYSPPIADYLRQHDWLKYIVRICLYPLIGFSYLMVHGFISWPFMILCTIVSLIFCLAWFVRHKLYAQ
jgi:lysophospholipase L1-like esterase